MTSSAVNAAFDYVVVGGGSAGCVLANRLSADGKYSVLLLEAGPPDNDLWLHIPIGYAKTMVHPVLNWGFNAEPSPELDNRRIYTPRGRTLGGSSAINGLIQIRGQPEDFDLWESLGATGWGRNEALKYFIKSEGNSRGANPWHGGDGPLAVSDIRDRHELIDAMIAGSEELGIPRTDDFNGASQEGAGYLQLTTKDGWRCSAAAAYLTPVRHRTSLQVETHAHVTRILFEGSRAIGVEYVKGREGRSMKTVTARAGREVLLAAGAIQSPQLLQLSGIGPGSLLQSLGIPVIADVPGVGENLQDHLILRILYKCTKPITTNDDLRNPFYKLMTGLRWLLAKRGPMAVGVMMGGMITRSLPESRTPDYQFFLSTVSAEDRGATPHPWSGFTFNYYPFRPTSRGHVRITTRDPKAAPAMQFNYLSTDEDKRLMLAGMKLTRRLAATKAFSPYIASEYKPGPSVQTDEEMLGYIRANATTGFHPCGTCRMGSDALAVVDPRLKVPGVQGLRVIDASVMPTVVSGNTNAATIMIGEKGADLVLEEARSGP